LDPKTYVKDTKVHDEVGVSLDVLPSVLACDGNVLAAGYQWDLSTLTVSFVNANKIQAKDIFYAVVLVLIIQKLIKSFGQVLFNHW